MQIQKSSVLFVRIIALDYGQKSKFDITKFHILIILSFQTEIQT